jgi:uncharacterized protein (TIGR02284 family)
LETRPTASIAGARNDISTLNFMKLSNDKNLRVLNDLIETCKDGRHGYETAAKDAKDAELSRVFMQYAQQRASYITELKERVRAFGGDPEKTGSVSGSLHRGWINIKSAVSSNEPHAVLAECERGEDVAVKNYREALNEGELDMETRALIQRQAAGVREAHDRIKELRDSVAYARK